MLSVNLPGNRFIKSISGHSILDQMEELDQAFQSVRANEQRLIEAIGACERALVDLETLFCDCVLETR